MKKIYVDVCSVLRLPWLLMLLFVSVQDASGQAPFYWRSEATNGNWNDANNWWNGSTTQVPTGADILYFQNNNQLTMTNNLTGGSVNRHKILFESGASSSRTISGSTVNNFFEFGTSPVVWPFIRNTSSALHTIGFPIAIGTNGSTYNLELDANTGPLLFSNTIANNEANKSVWIYGNNAAVDGNNRYVRFTGVISGSRPVRVTNFGVARYAAAHTYSGNTEVYNGELWIESGGSATSSTILVGDAAQQGQTAKLWLQPGAGGVTFSSPITINAGNNATRELGGLNTSGAHTFSGNVSIGSAGTNLALTAQSGGTVAFSGILSGTGGFSKSGAGVVQLSGSNTFGGPISINSGTLRLGATNTIPNTANLTFNADGVTLSSGATTGFSDQFGTLDLEGNATIALGTGNHTLTFGNSSGVTWNLTKTLTITGWTGSAGTSGTAGKIVVGAGGLTAAQLARIQFQGFAPGAVIVSGEVVPNGATITSFSVAAPGSGSSGYVGNTITLTGTGFTGASSLSVGGTSVGTFTVVNDNTITFAAIHASGTISMTSPVGTATSATAYTNLGYISTQNGDWNTASTWLGGGIPVASAPVAIAHQVTTNTLVTNTAGALQILSGGQLQPNTGSLTAASVTVNSGGTLAWIGTAILNISANGFLTNNGTLTAGTGSVNFLGAGTITGTITLNNLFINTGTLTNAATLRIGGYFTINGGDISAAPIYLNTSTLYYNVSYTRFREWNAVGVGTVGVTPGYPQHVLVYTGSLNMVTSETNAALACAGTLIVNTGATVNFNAFGHAFTAGGINIADGAVINGNTLSGNITVNGNLNVLGTGSLNLSNMTGDLDVNGNIFNTGTITLSGTIGADVFLSGNFTNSSAFNHNQRAVTLDGTATQQLIGNFGSTGSSNNFAFLNINKASDIVTLSNPVVVTNVLTLTSGLVYTSSTNTLTIIGTGVGAISGGSATSCVYGPLTRRLPANLASGSSYAFPVGKGTGYYPFTAVNPTTGAGTIAVTVEAFSSNPGGSLGAGIAAFSTTEYWSLSATGNFTQTAVSLNRPLAIGGFNTIARSTTANGAYDQLGGTVAGTAINNSATASGAAQFYRYATAVAPTVFNLTGGSTGCAATGLTYGLSGSQTGASYQLVRDGSVNVGSPLAGTGSAISFGSQTTAGVYTVVGYWSLNPASTFSMSGSSTLTSAGTWIGGATGSWNDPANWCGGVPVVTSAVVIPSGVAVSIDAAATANTITISTGSSLTFSTEVTLQIRAGGNITNNGTFSQTTGTVEMLGNSTIAGANASVFHNLSLRGTATLSRIPTVNGSLTILSSGAVNTALNYGPNSILHYNSGGGYNMASEWTGNSLTAGLGVPANVAITGTTVNFANTERGIGGNFTINAAGNVNLNGASGATLSIGGNYTWNTTAGSPVNNAGQTIIFNGPNNSVIQKTLGSPRTVFMDYMVVAKTGSGQVILSGPPATTTVRINAFNNNANPRLRLVSGTLNLNGQVFNLNAVNANAVANVSVGGGSQRIIASSPTAGGILSITGAVTGAGFATTRFSAESGGSTLLFDNSVSIQTGLGVDFGPTGLTLINSILQINANGFVIGNSPDYGDAATLIYNNGSGGYNRHFEWNTNVPGPGFPSNVVVQNNTPVNLDFYANTGLGTSARIEIQTGSSMTMGSMAHSLSAGTDLILNGTLTLSTTAGGDLNVGRNWNRSAAGVFNQNGRNVTFNGSEAATLTAAGGQTFSHMYLNKNALSQSLTLVDSVNITDVIGFTRGTLDLANRNITLLSTNTKTARVDTVKTPSNINLNYSGTGAFVVQRYLPINTLNTSRRWRLLTAPVSTTGAPTIQASWQEGASNVNRFAPVNPYPGFGTTITRSMTAQNGYDQGATNNPSLYALVNNVWTAPGATNSGSIRDFDAYMLFVRGDRSIVVTNQWVTPTPTTLRVKGRLNIGTVTRTLAASGFQALGNPYASAISFNDVVFNGVSPRTTAGRSFYLWDPKMAGTANVGGFVTATSLGNGKFAVTANASGYPTDNTFDGIIESGAGFLVQPAGGTFQFQENAKWAASSTVGIASRPQQQGNSLTDMQQLTVNLKVGQGAQAQVTDGVIALMKSGFRTEVDNDDARKIFSFSGAERLSLLRDSVRLSVELRDPVRDRDTFFLHTARLNRMGYELDVIDHNSSATQVALLEDRHLATRTVVPRNDTLRVPFEVNAAVTSGAEDRFRIIFRDAVRLQQLTATMPERDGILELQVGQEFEVSKYVLERSTRGNAYQVVEELASRGNQDIGQVYRWVDANLTPGIYHYRVKAVLKSGVVVYSNRATLEAKKTAAGIHVFPNPITGNTIRLQFNEVAVGSYEAQLFDAAGARVATSRLVYNGGFQPVTWILPGHVSAGTYLLELISPSGQRHVVTVLIRR